MENIYLKNWGNLLFVPVFSLWIFCAQSCSNDENYLDENFFLSVGEATLNFEQTASELEVEIRCSSEFTVDTSEGLSGWCNVNRNEVGNLSVCVEENHDKGVRTGEIYIVAQHLSDTISVSQLGWGKAILLSTNNIAIGVAGGIFDLDVTTNVDCEVDLSSINWLREIPSTQTRSHEVVTTHYSFEVMPNNSAVRQATIVIRDKDKNSEIAPVSLIVNQKGLDGYFPESSEVDGDIRIAANGVTGDNGVSEGHSYAKMIDGNADLGTNECWENDYLHHKFPQYIEFSFDNPQEIDYVIYYPSYSGHFKNIEIQVWSDINVTRSASYRTVYKGTMVQSSGATRIDFSESQAGVTKVKFIINDVYATRIARCCEMEFYKKNPLSFDWRTLFATSDCTDLRVGITEADILACPYSFYKNLAWYMFNNKYPREFRIADFKAYPHPDIQAIENKTGTYSLLDNPTGISVQKDEILVVMANLKGLESVNIRVQNLDTPGKDGFGGNEYTLRDGINTLKIKEKGLIYVMYHRPDYETAPPITLHFASGQVNGYFDSQNPMHEGRWNELLAASVDKYFDVVGKYAHLTFPTADFRNNTKEGKILIDLFDELVYREQEFLGLEKYNRMFKNRMYFNVMYTSYMYATSYRTSYNESTLDDLTDETLLKGKCWGPAHEVGHVNQTRPGLKWHGLTEVTNNITALYIQTSVWKQPSRLERDGVYSKAWNNIIVNEQAHAVESDVFCKLVPFWQLELYFGKVLGRSPMSQPDHGGFYPDVYQYIRDNPDLSTPGAQQLEFVYNCCLNGQVNLLDFFEKWGFLTPVKAKLDDYGEKEFLITQADVDALKSRVLALGLAKPDVALEYLTDSFVESYKKKATMVQGEALRNGNVVTLTGWKHVAAFEVKNITGKVVCVVEGIDEDGMVCEFTLPMNCQDGFTLEAVAIDGRRNRVIV